MPELAAGFFAGIAVGIAGTGWVMMLLTRRDKRRLDIEFAETVASSGLVRQNGNSAMPAPRANTWTS